MLKSVVLHLSATARSLSGLKVPSVSMYMALPSPPPWSIGSCTQSTANLSSPAQLPPRNETAGEPTWQVTASVWHNWVFPVRNSPNISVMEPVSIPPAQKQRLDFFLMDPSAWGRQDERDPPCSSLSSSLEPVEIWMISALLWWNSVAVVKPIGTSLAASAYQQSRVLSDRRLKGKHSVKSIQNRTSNGSSQVQVIWSPKY